MSLVKSSKTVYIISAAVFAAVGICMLIRPQISLTTICYATGAVLMFSGIIRLIGYFSKDMYNLAFQFDLALGIFSIILACLLFFRPIWIINLLPTVIGLFILINSLFTLQTAIDSKKFGLKYWWMLLSAAVISSIFGILLIVNPFKSAIILARIVGVTMICTGFEKIAVAAYTIRIKKKRKSKSISDITEVKYTEVK